MLYRVTYTVKAFLKRYLTKTEVIMTKFYTTALIALTLTVLTLNQALAGGGF